MVFSLSLWERVGERASEPHPVFFALVMNAQTLPELFANVLRETEYQSN